MGNSAASNESAYQAALITEQRALDGHTQAIDLLQRLLDSMGDDPLLVQTKTNLQKILENPEVITDEVFNNIMSKTGEILDTNYDMQVQEVLGAARAKGVSGPALQVTLQKAKQARAVAMASAYREAIISRSESGLKTNMDAITSATNLLNQLFTNQRATSQDLSTVMREVVPAPFQNFGVDDVTAGDPNAQGGVAGAGGSRQVSMNLPPQEPLGAWGERMAAEQAASDAGQSMSADTAALQKTQDARNAASRWNPDGTPKMTATEQTPAAVPGTPGVPVALNTKDQQLASQGPASGTGTFEMDGKKYTMDANGVITPVDYTGYDTSNRNGGIPLMTQNANPLSPASGDYEVAPSVAAAQRDSAMTTDMQAAVKLAMAPLSNVGYQVSNQFSPTQPISVLPTVDYGKTMGAAYATSPDGTYKESTLKSGGQTVSAGGGGVEASRGADLVSTYGMPGVVGTTAGYGVKDSAIAPKTGVNNYGGAGTQYATQTGSDSPGASVASPAQKLASTYGQQSDPYAGVKTGSQAAGAKDASGRPLDFGSDAAVSSESWAKIGFKPGYSQYTRMGTNGKPEYVLYSQKAVK